jgi:hypothetical protein
MTITIPGDNKETMYMLIDKPNDPALEFTFLLLCTTLRSEPNQMDALQWTWTSLFFV